MVCPCSFFFHKEKALHYQEEEANMMAFTANMYMLLKMFKFMQLCVSVGVVVVFFLFCVYMLIKTHRCRITYKVYPKSMESNQTGH